MKRPLYLLMVVFSYQLSAQSFPVKNVIDEYFVTNIYNPQVLERPLHEFVRDKNGLYWFQFFTEIYSFDGANWKSYQIKAPNRSTNPFRINDLQTTSDGNVWLGTEYGLFVFDPPTDCFISINEKFPHTKVIRQAISCTFEGPPGKFIYRALGPPGFYLFDLNTKQLKHVMIDTADKVFISVDGQQLTTDRNGNIWGTTTDYRGIWHYNSSTGQVRRSWKGELAQFAHSRFKDSLNISYSEKENSLWFSNGRGRYLEKMNLKTGESVFFSFTGNLEVHPDTSAVNRHFLVIVKTDRDGNEWINVGNQYIVKLDKDISKFEYLTNDNDRFRVGELRKFRTETPVDNDQNNFLLLVHGIEKLSMISKRGNVVKHIPFDTLSQTNIKPADYLNTITDARPGRQHIFFEKGRNDHYILLQQNAGRPKLICFDKDLRVKTALLTDQWRTYPAYFSRDFDPDTFFIAILRPGIEPLDFRNVVYKDFRVDLHTLTTQEVELDFSERVFRYGQADKYNVRWLFSNGYLYSFDPAKTTLDSIFICKPTGKGSARENMIKGYDYPVLLHKNSSTFWISFYGFPTVELYKINLISKKIEKVFKPCMDRPDCNVPGGVYAMYPFDSSNIYLRSSLHGMLINARTDSITNLSELFQKKLPLDGNFAGTYKNWMYAVFPRGIYLKDKVSGTQRELIHNLDFKWPLTLFKSNPLVNDHGEMILMSNWSRGFLVFNIDTPIVKAIPGLVRLSFIKVDEKNLLLDSLFKNKGLVLKYNSYQNIQLAFSDLSLLGKTSYEYALLKGTDTNWNKINGKPELTFADLSPGNYRLLLRASNVYGDYSPRLEVVHITILPPYWQTWWFRSLIVLAIGLIFYGLYRYRLKQLKKLQTIRNNIASDLHDDIGSTLNSISIYSEVAKQQAGRDIPALDLIGQNSRKIIESMSDIVWTINPENDSFEKIIVRMRSFAHQLLKAKKVEYTFEIDEKLNGIKLPMQVRKNFYLVFKEAITNVIKYSEASRVSILLYEKHKGIMLRIRDNGKGIPVNASTQGNGLLNMTRRASEIKAELNINSPNGGGTEIELMLENNN